MLGAVKVKRTSDAFRFCVLKSGVTVVTRLDFAHDKSAQGRWRLSRIGFVAAALITELLAIVGLSLLTGVIYHFYAYGGIGMLDLYARLGFLAALLYTLPFLFRNEYQFNDYLEQRKPLGRVTWIWGFTFACLAVIGFMTKTTEAYSRGWVATFFVLGPPVLMLVSSFIRGVLKRLIDVGRVEPRRLMLVGDSTELERFEQQLQGNASAVRVVATVALPYRGMSEDDTETLTELQASFDDAVARARLMRVDDVIVFSEWSNRAFAERAIAAFSILPAALHLGASDLIGKFRKAQVWRFADMTTVSLTVPPLTAAEAFVKRVLDLVVTSLALLLLSPVMLVVAALIRWDSDGPILFRQRRRGFNHQKFKILKFRTMTTLDDGETIVQARSGDERVTRVGGFLRRWNLDELPQLINVLKGEMSLVGPRPHAVAHDKLYERRFDTYARRLNMRPGITGWAQVQGYRGATETDHAMQRRLDHDLYYIDNWSLWLDLYVLVLTVLSPKAYHNAH